MLEDETHSLGPPAHHRFLSDFLAWPSSPHRQVFSAQDQPAPASFLLREPVCPLQADLIFWSRSSLGPRQRLPCMGTTLLPSAHCLHSHFLSHHVCLGTKVSSNLAYLFSTSPCVIFFRVLSIIGIILFSYSLSVSLLHLSYSQFILRAVPGT